MLEDHADLPARVAQRLLAERRDVRSVDQHLAGGRLSSPLTRRISVDLPAPERPMIAVIEPRGAARSIPSSATTSPEERPAGKLLETASKRTIASPDAASEGTKSWGAMFMPAIRPVVGSSSSMPFRSAGSLPKAVVVSVLVFMARCYAFISAATMRKFAIRCREFAFQVRWARWKSISTQQSAFCHIVTMLASMIEAVAISWE